MPESEKRDATVRIGGAAGNESETGLAQVDGHSGIFKPRFLTFVADLVFAHADQTARREANLQFHQGAHTLAPASP
jgi:hypothetical protein